MRSLSRYLGRDNEDLSGVRLCGIVLCEYDGKGRNYIVIYLFEYDMDDHVFLFFKKSSYQSGGAYHTLSWDAVVLHLKNYKLRFTPAYFPGRREKLTCTSLKEIAFLR